MGCVNEGCCSVWRIVQSVLGILLGLLSGTAFFWQYGNYQAAAWAFASGKYLNHGRSKCKQIRRICAMMTMQYFKFPPKSLR